MRIQKYMSEQSMASRREAERLIKRGLVSVNGTVVREMGVQIDPAKDTVEVLPFAKKEMAAKQTIALYKPRGIASSRVRAEGTSVYDLFPKFSGLDIVGRLDKASEGLLMLSDDGVIAKAVTGAAHVVEKEYEVAVREEVNAGRLKMLEPGIELEDGMTLPAKTHFINKHLFRIVLREGRKHQIRRMCEFLHLTVVYLKRLRIGPVVLSGLKPGEYRLLTPQEIALLKRSVSNSPKPRS
ncbi:MAG: pseudouridine synthase [Patescibacteria group bacterium]